LHYGSCQSEETVEKLKHRSTKNSRSGDKLAIKTAALSEKLLEHLSVGNTAATFEFDKKDEDLAKVYRDLHLLTAKPT